MEPDTRKPEVQFGCSMRIRKRRDGRLEGRVKLDDSDETFVTQPPRKNPSAVRKDMRTCVIENLDEALDTLPIPD